MIGLKSDTPKWAKIRQYRDFWDFPRMLIVDYRGRTLLLDCPFDDATEDYREDYRVYLMPEITSEELAGSWEDLPSRAVETLGTLACRDVEFDPGRRESVSTRELDRLLGVGTGAEDDEEMLALIEQVRQEIWDENHPPESELEKLRA